MNQDTNKISDSTNQLSDTIVARTLLLSKDSFQTKTHSIDTVKKVKPGTEKDTKKTKKFFTENNYQHKAFISKKNESKSIDWILGILILCLFLYTFAHAFYNKRIRQIFSAFGAKNYANQLIKERNLFNDRISIPLFIIYILSFSLFIYQFLIYFVDEEKFFLRDYTHFLAICVLLILFWAVKIILILLSGIIFHTEKRTKEYLQNMLIFALILGAMLVPVNILIAYSNTHIFLFIGILITIINLIVWYIRGFLIGLSYKNYSILYLFIYLCSLEILPLIVIAKMVVKNYLI